MSRDQTGGPGLRVQPDRIPAEYNINSDKKVDVKADDGKTERWTIGGPAINRMEANGWTSTTVKVGDMITGTGYQFMDGQKIIRLERVVLADGKELRVYGR